MTTPRKNTPVPHGGYRGLNGKIYPSVEDRFWGYVSPEPNSGCWLWMGALSNHGYARMAVERKNRNAYKWAYQHFVGPVPPGKELDHKCRVRSCVNPWHLDPKTHKENLAVGVSPTALNARKTHCKYGHPFSGGNLAITKGGSRQCRICLRRRYQETMSRRKTQ